MKRTSSAILGDLQQRDLAGALAEACDAHDALPCEVLGRTRSQSADAARREFYVALYDGGLSYGAIGRIVGRDPSTVLQTVRGTFDLDYLRRRTEARRIRTGVEP